MVEFTVEEAVAEVTEEDVDNIIEVFRKQQGSWKLSSALPMMAIRLISILRHSGWRSV